MSKKRDIHVVPREGKWATKQEGAQRAGAIYSTKAEAKEQGRAQAKRGKSELVIHGTNGRIQDKDSFGNDPIPPRDLKH